MTDIVDIPPATTKLDAALPLEGKLAIPRNGEEPVFSAPWEGQVFAAAIMLRQAERFAWSEFVDVLAKHIGNASNRSARDGADYYRHWLDAFESLIVRRGVVDAEEISERYAVLAAAQSHVHGSR